MKKLCFVLGVIFCLGTAGGVGVGDAYARDVYYNTNSGIWHNQSCQHSHCKNCIKIDQVEAKRRGGRACRKCGG